MLDGKKVMFEIFREQHHGNYRVVYYTELCEHEKEDALNEAMNGVTVFSGYLLYRERDRARVMVDEVLARLNAGETLSETEIESRLSTVCV